MLVSGVSIHRITAPNHFQHHHFHPPNPTSRSWKQRQKSSGIRCCNKVEERLSTEKNYYKLLGVSADSTNKQIKEAYRKLQKKYHPDIAGQKGHEYTLMLNEAYKVLMREDLRREYDASIGQLRISFGRNIPDLGFSSWKGPFRPQALFVDENACIGHILSPQNCRVHILEAKNPCTVPMYFQPLDHVRNLRDEKILA